MFISPFRVLRINVTTFAANKTPNLVSASSIIIWTEVAFSTNLDAVRLTKDYYKYQ